MVAAIDWCSHTTHDWIWLASCFGFNGPLRHYFRLSLPKREEEKTKDRRKKKMSKQPRPTPYASAIRPCPTFIQISGTPRHCKFTRHRPTIPSGLDFGDSLSLSLSQSLSLNLSVCLSASLSLSLCGKQ